MRRLRRWQFPQIEFRRLFMRCDRCGRLELPRLAYIRGSEALCTECYHAKYLTESPEQEPLDTSV